MILDNDFGENQILRTLDVTGNTSITSLNFDSLSKLIIIGTNTGITGFYESDTGKQSGTFQESSGFEEISYTCVMNCVPYIITISTLGKINFIALPPLLYKMTKVYGF
jgi:hypothetical protein